MTSIPFDSRLTVGARHRRAGMHRQTRAVLRRPVRRLVVVVCLLPLLAVLARQAPRFVHAPLLLSYGVLVLSVTIALFYIAYTRYDDPSQYRIAVRADEDFPTLRSQPSVTLMVAVKDEAGGIEACVRSMVGSDYRDLEVIVVDDGSTDGTVQVLRELQSRLRFRLLALPSNVGKKHALVQASRVAHGQILAFTDSDCVLAPDALRRCVEAMVKNPELGALSGHARALNAEATLLTRAQDAWYEGSFRVTKAAEASFGTVTCVSGPLAVFRREAIYNYLPAWADDVFLGGEFRFATDRQLTGYVLGQRYIGAQVKQLYQMSSFVRGRSYPERLWRVSYVRSAQVWTNVPASPRALLRQQVRWKKSFIRNLFFTGRFMWRRGAGPAALYYGHVVWVLAAPLMAVRHLVWAPWHGMWMLSALYLCGVTLKGVVWGLAYKIDNPGCTRWRYRPLMSLLSATVLSWLLVYSAVTIRRGIWSRAA